jgi:hypothetical protein
MVSPGFLDGSPIGATDNPSHPKSPMPIVGQLRKLKIAKNEVCGCARSPEERMIKYCK